MSMKSLLDPATDLILEDAIAQEVTAAFTYRQIANLCKRIGMFGAAQYFLKESDEELSHYQKIADYLNDRGSVAVIPDVKNVVPKMESLRQALEFAYKFEVDLNGMYEKWFRSVSAYDPTTAQFLLQFIEIQRVSIGEYGDFISTLDTLKDDPAAILAVDEKMGG